MITPVGSGVGLATYACDPARSKGRRHPEDAAPTRNVYQRDRDRVVHSSSFRRLVYKTQVFLNHEGDLFRTRLTHSLEVAQLGRSMARSLGLSEDLVEVISLSHDLGHTPFGHAGQDALNECMISSQASGAQEGFEHNLQSLRVVDRLEQRYPAYDGLNLTFETREGILKHCSKRNAERIEQLEPHGVGHRFLQGTQPSLEAQLCNLADEIAYNTHDIDDGLRSGLIAFEDLEPLQAWMRHLQEVKQEHPGLDVRRTRYAVLRRLLSEHVYDVIRTSQQLISQSGAVTVEDVRSMRQPLVRFSDQVRSEVKEIKHFLMHALYRHERVMENMLQARQVVQDLFGFYMNHPSALPVDFQRTDEPLVRCVADYIAGMTDRFAIRDHAQRTGKQLFGLQDAAI
ncbi:MAG: Deoxyguanosinetriphosphate triphosphohydrolase [Pseudomonadota bacterium]